MGHQETNDREWSSPANWHWGIYHAPLDSRVWVPKPRKWMGWTLNFAHRVAYVWLAVLLLPALLTVVLCVIASMNA